MLVLTFLSRVCLGDGRCKVSVVERKKNAGLHFRTSFTHCHDMDTILWIMNYCGWISETTMLIVDSIVSIQIGVSYRFLNHEPNLLSKYIQSKQRLPRR